VSGFGCRIGERVLISLAARLIDWYLPIITEYSDKNLSRPIPLPLGKGVPKVG
jgi:hypothetical protein